MEVEAQKEGEMITISEITRLSNEQAHEVACRVAHEGNSMLYEAAYDRVFNFLYRKLLMPNTDETPGWVVRLANYFNRDSEIDDVDEKMAVSEDPLNQAEYVVLTVRFKRNMNGPVMTVGTETMELE